jgi:hypothetical protein
VSSSDAALAAISLALFVGIYMASLVLHELGHALGAKWIGADVYKIVIGEGKRLARFKALGFLWEIGINCLGGACYPEYPKPLPGMRWRKIAVIAAGPLMNLLLVAAALTAYAACPSPESFLAKTLLLAALTNVFLLFGSLIPFESTEDKQPTDMLALIRTLGVPESALADLVRYSYVARATDLVKDGKLAEASALFEEKCSGTQADFGLLMALAHELLSRGDPKGEEFWNRLLAHPEFQRGQEREHILARFLSSIALCPQSPTPALANAVETSADELGHLKPEDPTGQLVRGAALVRVGNVMEGLELLRRAERTCRPSTPMRALHATYRAAAELGRGEVQLAGEFLHTALSLDPSSEIARALRTRLQSTSPSDPLRKEKT